MNHTRRLAGLLSGIALAAGAAGVSASTSGAHGQATTLGVTSQAPTVTSQAPTVTSEKPSAAQTAGLTPAELALLNSGQPVNVVMDPNTGDIESVTAAHGGGSAPEITRRGAACDRDDGCSKTDQSPPT